MNRLPPDSARQKFYTAHFLKGCLLVAFYNHRSKDFSPEEIALMIAVATEHFADLPWQITPPDDPVDATPISQFVWVDITDGVLYIGHALTEDQTAIGYDSWQKGENYDAETKTICSCLQSFAQSWRKRRGNMDSIEGEPAVIGRLTSKK